MIRAILHIALCSTLAPLLAAELPTAQQQAKVPVPTANSLPKAEIHAPCWTESPEKHNEMQTRLPSTAVIPPVITIPKNTMIKVRALEPLSSETAVVGSPVGFAVAEDVVVDGVTVIHAGVPVAGTVVQAKRGIPYRQWADLRVRVDKVIVGNSTSLLLTRSDPRHHKKWARSDAKDLAMCAVIPLFCIAGALGASEDGPERPNAESGVQGEVTLCETWYFWTRSSITISSKEISDGKLSASTFSTVECSRMLENPECDYLEIQ